MKAYYDQNRELILLFSLQTSSISGKSKGKEIIRGRSIPFGCNMSMIIRAQGNGISFACVLASRLRVTMLFASPPPPPPPPPPCKLSTLCKLADGLLVGPFISEFCSVQAWLLLYQREYPSQMRVHWWSPPD